MPFHRPQDNDWQLQLATCQWLNYAWEASSEHTGIQNIHLDMQYTVQQLKNLHLALLFHRCKKKDKAYEVCMRSFLV